MEKFIMNQKRLPYILSIFLDNIRLTDENKELKKLAPNLSFHDAPVFDRNRCAISISTSLGLYDQVKTPSSAAAFKKYTEGYTI